MGQDEFPDLDVSAAHGGGGASNEPTVSKANNSSAMYNMFSGATAKGGRADGAEGEEQKQRP